MSIVRPRVDLPDFGKILTRGGVKHKLLEFAAKEPLFQQGDPANSVFYLQTGHTRLSILSKRGKEATIAVMAGGDFLGEDAIDGATRMRLTSATALTDCTAVKVMRAEMLSLLNRDREFSNSFLRVILARSQRTQADLVDHLFNSSEMRLARVLLLMAEYGQPGEPEQYIPPVNQTTLAEMVGTTRGRVSFFMNRFRKMGFIDYNGRIKVNRSLLNIVLNDTMPGETSAAPRL